jgi:hypothetical protein
MARRGEQLRDTKGVSTAARAGDPATRPESGADMIGTELEHRRLERVVALLVLGALAGGAGSARADTAGRPPATKPRDWPGSTDGLVFLWHDASRANQIAAPGGKGGRTCRAAARGLARYGRFHDMDLAGGAFVAEGVNEALLAACRESHQLTVEAVITPDRAKQDGPARIVTFSRDASSRNFTLGQQGDKLVVRLRTPRNGANGSNVQPELCRLKAGRAHHVIVAYRPGLTVCYLDGRQVASTKAVRGDFRNWEPQRLLFGDEWDGGRDWAGRLEGIAVYSRCVGADEARRKAEAYRRRLARRKPVERLVVLGECIETTPTPTLKSIHPYRRCLAVYTYAVRKVLQGKCGHKKIQVAHWVILGGKPLGFERKRGQTCKLVLEPFDDHPQLQAERLVMEQDEFDLPMYYDVQR